MGISIFAKHVYFLEDSKGRLFPQRVSTIIRAEQIAEYLGAKLNPTSGFENDVCVYVKASRNVENLNDGDYVDVLDDVYTTERIKTRPGVKVIAMSGPHYDWLKSILPNEIVHIPHQHMNFENARRNRKKITTCGYVGAYNSYHERINEEVEKRLAEIGFKFIPLFNFTTRQDIIDFYKKIDIQVIGYFNYHTDVPCYHHKKIVDAMSFGVPTIAGPKLGYRDVDDFYIKVNNMDELITEVIKMRNKKEYDKWPDKLIKEADKYHISNIAKLYQNLT